MTICEVCLKNVYRNHSVALLTTNCEFRLFWTVTFLFHNNDTDVEQIALKCYCGSVEFKSWFFNIPYKDPEFLKLIPGLEQ